MNWTETPPTKPGAYWWRRYKGEDVVLCNVEPDDNGILDAWASWGVISVAMRGGEWCGPLVPAEEVEKAWSEGFKSADPSEEFCDTCWIVSRARRVVEGGDA